MDIKFFGYGSAFYPKLGTNNAYFEWEDDFYLIDCGGSTYEKIVEHINLNHYKNIYVLITHLHADHVGSLGTLISYIAYVIKKDITVIYPEKSIKSLLDLQGIDRKFYQYLPSLPEESSIKIEAFEVVHADDMKCYGYILNDGIESIYYSGDSAFLNDIVKQRFLAGNIQRIYHDTSTVESKSHCYIQRLEQDIPEHLRKNVYCMHLNCDCQEQLKEKGFQVVQIDVV